MPIYRVSYKIIHGEKCSDTRDHPDKLFSRILEGINQKDTREIWEGKTEWLLHTEEYTGKLCELAAVILRKFDEIRERKCIFEKRECGQANCKFLSLQLCVSEVNHYGFYPDTDADAEIIQWLEGHNVTVYYRKTDNHGRIQLTNP